MHRWAVIFAAIARAGALAPAGTEPPTSQPTAPALSVLPDPPSAPVTVIPASPAASNPPAERRDLTPTFELRGRIQTDAVLAAQSTSSKALIGDLQNGYGFRRARLGKRR